MLYILIYVSFIFIHVHTVQAYKQFELQQLLPALPYTPDQLFFISFGQVMFTYELVTEVCIRVHVCLCAFVFVCVCIQVLIVVVVLLYPTLVISERCGVHFSLLLVWRRHCRVIHTVQDHIGTCVHVHG